VKQSALILAALGFLLPWASLARADGRDPAMSPASVDSPSTPRRSPEFVVHLANGKEMLLSSFRGKVVALMFVHTTCPVCQQASQIFSKLYADYGERGFQPVVVAFNSQANLYVPEFVRKFDLRYPVGFSSVEDVAAYLDFPAGERFTIPQIVWIDGSGFIRNATPLKGDENRLTETCWRSRIDSLLKEQSEAPE